MSDVFIPLGGAGGKNRGTAAVLGDSTPFSNAGAVMSLPLPAGNYKKSVSNPRTSYGDGKNSEVTISKGLLKQMAIDAFGIASITNFSLSMYAHKQVRLTWGRPNKGLWSGVHFVFKYDSMPTSVTDGFYTLDSADVHFETGRLEELQLYIRAFNYVTTNSGRWYDDGAVSATIRVSGISGAVSFGAGAGTWTVPEGVRRIRYILVGRGGDGGYGNYYVPGGGGGGGYFTTGYMDVSPGQNISWIVPTAEKQATVFNGVTANAGRSPAIGEVILSGGNGHYASGGNGGSGGSAYAGTPGSDGGDGTVGAWSVSYGRRGDKTTYNLEIWGGTGQHSTTRGFNGVLYSTGGYAGKKTHNSAGSPGTDGLGNGGNGVNNQNRENDLPPGNGGTGCIYIAWGSSMNDGS